MILQNSTHNNSKSEGLTVEDIKKVSSGILFRFDEICVKYGITYSVFYGTLLGAVRHKGFIPWDDDIDIVMLRNDYNKLVQVIKQYDPFDGTIKLYDVDITSKYSAPLAKLIDTRTTLNQYNHAEKVELGVYIDVFVFDNVPRNDNQRTKLYSKIDKLQRKWAFCEYKAKMTNKNIKSLIVYLAKSVLNLGFARVYAKKMSRIARSNSYLNKDENLVGNLLFAGYNRDIDTFQASTIVDVQRVPFEDHEVFAVKDSDLVLRQIYGNYMELPPLEKRVTHHSFNCFWKQSNEL